MAQIRKLFTNIEIQYALDTSDTITDAAKALSALKNVTVTSQLLTYWKKHLETHNRSGLPYQGTAVVDRKIRADMVLRKPEPSDYDSIIANAGAIPDINNNETMIISKATGTGRKAPITATIRIAIKPASRLARRSTGTDSITAATSRPASNINGTVILKI